MSRVADLLTVVFLLVVSLLVTLPASGQDIRAAARKAAADRSAAQAEAQLSEQRILADRDSLLAAVRSLEQQQKKLETTLSGLEKREKDGVILQGQLEKKWGQRELGLKEISGNVRVAARELESLLKASVLSAGYPQRLGQIQALLQEGYFPDLNDIVLMSAVFFDEMQRAGQVTWQQGSYIGRDGRETTGPILQVGKFTSVYRLPQEIGFLEWSPDQEQLSALPALPSRGVRAQLKKYLSGQTDDLPVDISGGSALRQLGFHTSFLDQVRAGGPVMYPIFLIALAALAIVISRIVFLRRAHGNTDRIMGQVNDLAEAGDWEGCQQVLDQHSERNWPVVHVIRAGLEARNEDRSTLETILQEAILHELPRIQKGVAILAVLGAVAPLLGLLGTVTGMIDTFRVITLFGTSDPKLMSGGISEALITTELGLAVAIPIMLLHAYISRRSDHLIGDMEEKAVQLTNIIQKQQALEEVES